MRILALALAVALALGSRASAQEAKVYLVTMDPGSSAYEYFGHNAIWLSDPATGENTAYNWGVFSFDEPGFYTKFLKGLLIYSMEGRDMGQTLYAYQYYNRSVHVQELNMTAQQKSALREFVHWNNRPENRKYRYHYYRDNCSTRVRDALDRALGGALKRSLQPRSSGQTFRSETQRLSAHDIPIYTGLMIAMGPMLDAPLSAWEASFIPMRLQEYVRTVQIDGKPLVLSEQTLFQAERPAVPAEAPNLLPAYLIAGLIFAGVLALLGTMRNRWAHRVFVALAGVFELVIGLVGTIMLLLWLLTDHDVTYRNENVLQANSLSLVIFVALVALVLRRVWAPKIALRFAMVVAGLSVLGLLMQVLPQLDQANGEIIALLLPVHIAIAWVLLRLAQYGERRLPQQVETVQ